MIEIQQPQMVDRLAQIIHMMEKLDQEKDLRNKMVDLLKKAHQQEFSIAFCGHFSAGKSTMVNRLFGKDVLPTSPIPTSANVVKIRKGSDQVTLWFTNGQSHTYAGAYSEQELKQLFKNGDEVIAIDLDRHDAPLPTGVALLDTPGIDSTDDAHRIATESAIHLSDIIFYMMDYNHVQSEVNLQFVKELKQRGKIVYLVINQIDKHREEEISFVQYQESVKQSFANWDLEIDGYFYTSLRNPMLPHNDLDLFKNTVQQMIQDRDVHIRKSIENEANYLLSEYVRRWKERIDEQITQELKEIQVENRPTLAEITKKVEESQQKYQEVKEQIDLLLPNFLSEIDHILKNAYLMPYEVRELAHQFLETEKSDFKVGFFFSRGKTEKERERRLEAFYEKLKQTVSTQIETHLKQTITQYLKKNEVYTEKLGQEVYGLTIELSPDLLKQVVKSGAGLTGNYVLQYTEDLANEIKRRYRQGSERLFNTFSEELKTKLRDQEQSLKRQLEHQLSIQKVIERSVNRQQEQEESAERLYSFLTEKSVPELTIDVSIYLNEEVPSVSHQRYELPIASEETRKEEEVIQTSEKPASISVQQILQQVQKAEAIISHQPSLQTIYEELVQKRKRVENKAFTVALFGAFSAGKSSFANALMGDSVLPVSPNPTTATINRICPPTEAYPHGTALIHFKSSETLYQDLQQVFALFQQKINSLNEGLKKIPKLLSQATFTDRQKLSFPFLQAVHQGFERFSDDLGQTKRLSIGEFADYVANEEVSSFVELAELYYDSPWAELGVTLVDTPGADSMHARHTDVAFQYIKNADAILFVTYYNHAFSRADREFLIQLGRVKDSFAMDKMFFIINAADLAHTEDELSSVQEYLESQLRQFGIQNARLFAVSSLMGLEEKKGIVTTQTHIPGLTDSGMSQVEKAFSFFLMNDLLMVSVYGLLHQIQQATQVVQQMIQRATQGNDEKKRAQTQIEAEKGQLLQQIQQLATTTTERALQQEIQELLYYVKQRLLLRYNDVFREFFNPTTLREDGGSKKQRLRLCAQELLDFIKHDLLQELRATSLRIENWLTTQLDLCAEDLTSTCVAIHSEFPIHFSPESMFQAPLFSEPMAEMKVDSMRKELALYKDAKSFFEKNEKEILQEAMKKKLENEISLALNHQQQALYEHYQQQWTLSIEQFKQEAIGECEQYVESILYALSDEVDLEQLQGQKLQLSEVILEMESGIVRKRS
ncbi:dynamin family protein [Hazenella coriacea]|uniref:Small GTP-binding protein n=1 Tax=Hazenella coriacea TaxID=1179467 RepID=A0A4R3L6M8_9BACL|nr:dynamin family protein [Hazenella coriacea]TCS94675.1 small GTP-binding protein [Hazenella coriacea]